MELPNVDVKIVSSCLVKPASSDRSEHSYLLTAIDHFVASVPYRKRILFYKKPESGDFSYSELIKRLKESLAEALVAFYPFAGRLRRRESDGKVEACRFDAGAMFAEAEVGIRLEDLGSDFQNRDWFWNLAVDAEGTSLLQPWTPDTPTLSVQVTRFVCGGYSVGLTYSHQVSDGHSFWHFWKTWAQIASKSPFIQLPDFSRHLLHPAAGDYSIPPHISACYIFENYSQKAELAASKQGGRPKTVVKTFTFSRQFLSQLKQLANGQQQELRAREKEHPVSFTTYEVLCGHVWQRMTLAREVPASNPTKFLVTTGTRERLRSLPPTYFGNALHVNTTIPVTAQELTSRPLAFASGLLREAKVKYDEAAMQAVVNAFTKHQNDNNPIFYHWGPDDITVASSHNFPAYEVDYGWGKPERVRAGLLYSAEGYLMLFRGPQPGSIDVQFSLQPESMKALEQDPKFLCA